MKHRAFILTSSVLALAVCCSNWIEAQGNVHRAKQGFSSRLQMDNRGALGVIAYPSSPPAESLGIEYPLGSNAEHLFGAGMWVGGLLDTSGSFSGTPLRLVTTFYEGWAESPLFEGRPGPTPADTIWRATRQDTATPPGWVDYWGASLPYDPISDNDLYCVYTDTSRVRSGYVPLRLKVVQSSYAWDSPVPLTILDYRIFDIGTRVIDSVYVGWLFDADVGPIEVAQYWTRNYSAYFQSQRTAYVHNPIDVRSTPIGLHLLTAPLPLDSVRLSFQWFRGFDTPPNDTAKYAFMSTGEVESDEYPNLSDTRFLLSVGPFTLRPPPPARDPLRIAVAIVSGENLTELQENALYADSLYHVVTGIADAPPRFPTRSTLFQNYPNPFNPVTTIRYEIPRESKVVLSVYNILGQEVATLVNDVQKAGRYSVEFQPNLGSGVYFYRLQAGDFVETKKLLLLK